MILLLDNYDSFVFNVARSFRELGAEVEVVRSDALTVAEAVARVPSRVVLSPGPCTPAEAGISVELVRVLEGRVPILGICLGHQAVAAAYGASLVPALDPAHGRAAEIFHAGEGILAGLPSPFPAGLYHSLAVRAGDLPDTFSVAARTRAGEIMALRHRTHPVWGVQFHPESVLTPVGQTIFENFLALGSPEGAGAARRREESTSAGGGS
ncbi:MAG: aminodeoxychorismate/anthranilate synthase component II [Gemmatimonadota bacterium]